MDNIRNPDFSKKERDDESVEIDVVEEYAYKQIEEDLIKYICEKIVAMRE